MPNAVYTPSLSLRSLIKAARTSRLRLTWVPVHLETVACSSVVLTTNACTHTICMNIILTKDASCGSAHLLEKGVVLAQAKAEANRVRD